MRRLGTIDLTVTDFNDKGAMCTSYRCCFLQHAVHTGQFSATGTLPLPRYTKFRNSNLFYGCLSLRQEQTVHKLTCLFPSNILAHLQRSCGLYSRGREVPTRRVIPERIGIRKQTFRKNVDKYHILFLHPSTH
jgi:hypothetical protein